MRAALLVAVVAAFLIGIAVGTGRSTAPQPAAGHGSSGEISWAVQERSAAVALDRAGLGAH